jgi:hypothetical protein
MSDVVLHFKDETSQECKSVCHAIAFSMFYDEEKIVDRIELKGERVFPEGVKPEYWPRYWDQWATAGMGQGLGRSKFLQEKKRMMEQYARTEEEELAALDASIAELEGRKQTPVNRKSSLIISALMTSSSIEEAAAKAKVSGKTVSTLLRDPDFQREYYAAQKMTTAHVVIYLKNMFGDVVQRLYEILCNESHAVSARVQAAGLLMRYSFEMIQRDVDEKFKEEIRYFIAEIKARQLGQGQVPTMKLMALAEAGDEEAEFYGEAMVAEVDSSEGIGGGVGS